MLRAVGLVSEDGLVNGPRVTSKTLARRGEMKLLIRLVRRSLHGYDICATLQLIYKYLAPSILLLLP